MGTLLFKSTIKMSEEPEETRANKISVDFLNLHCKNISCDIHPSVDNVFNVKDYGTIYDDAPACCGTFKDKVRQHLQHLF